ncbi:MAG TPA: hypothetical protein VF466_03165 [Candidatus Saccharimonadales bacterium]
MSTPAEIGPDAAAAAATTPGVTDPAIIVDPFGPEAQEKHLAERLERFAAIAGSELTPREVAIAKEVFAHGMQFGWDKAQAERAAAQAAPAPAPAAPAETAKPKEDFTGLIINRHPVNVSVSGQELGAGDAPEIFGNEAANDLNAAIKAGTVDPEDISADPDMLQAEALKNKKKPREVVAFTDLDDEMHQFLPEGTDEEDTPVGFDYYAEIPERVHAGLGGFTIALRAVVPVSIARRIDNAILNDPRGARNLAMRYLNTERKAAGNDAAALEILDDAIFRLEEMGTLLDGQGADAVVVMMSDVPGVVTKGQEGSRDTYRRRYLQLSPAQKDERPRSTGSRGLNVLRAIVERP